MMPIKHSKGNGYLQQLRRKASIGNRSSELIFPIKKILRNGWLMASVSTAIATIGIFYAFTLMPIYEANILIQIQRNTPLSTELQADIPAATVVEIIRSRSILSRVVDILKLDTIVKPKPFPVLGRCTGEMNEKPGQSGHGGYVWGTEQVHLSLFSVPDALLRQPFILHITAENDFTLSQEKMAICIKGRVAEMTKAATQYGTIEILINDIKSNHGAQFVISQTPKIQVIEQLQKSLAISEMGKQSNIIRVSLRGAKPELISRIINEIGKEYIRQQLAQQSDEARKALTFYDQQVEESKQRLQILDTRSAQVLHRYGTADLSEEARTLAQQSVALQTKLADEKQKKVELLSRFAEPHPEVMIVTRHIQALARDLDGIDAKRKKLAAGQQDILLVNRDKQIYSEMNISLLNSRNKIDLLTQSHSVRLLDWAEAPLQPVTHGRSVMIAIACLLGLVSGIIASMVRNFIAGMRSEGSISF